MKKTLLGISGLIFLFLMSCNQLGFNENDPSNYPLYDGSDLGVTYTPQVSAFKLWAPTAQKVILRIYEEGSGGDPIETLAMKKGDSGIWIMEIKDDFLGKFYTFQTLVSKKWYNEVPGPYAKAVGVNGKRGMIVNLEATNPEGWKNDTKPELKAANDIILYEVHVRDFSIHKNSGMQNKGKFLAFTEEGTKSQNGLTTGIDYIKELGVTHVHLLPSFDYRSVDETMPDKPQYNWGYDPQNFNVPDGSYSTNPNDGNVRIKEFKQMVQALHKNGIRVILDVVYNHVGNVEEQSFQQTVPGYYFRFNADGTWSNATGCGNETASERAMMRKYIIESVKYWAIEYHLDGFRFDLMGVHDINTMNLVAEELYKIDSTIFIYGEGWTAGDSPLPIDERAIKQNMPKVNGVAAFSDEIRDGIKGHWNNLTTKGFVSGEPNLEESVKFGIVGGTMHPQVNYKLVNNSQAPWANSPTQIINYVSCHDNNTLWDKLLISTPESSVEERIRMDKMANTIVLTAQGIPFLHEGVEFLRTKMKVENSYDSPDSINWIDWSLKDKNIEVVDYYKTLIKLRKAHPAFRMSTTELVSTHLKFLDVKPGVIAYSIDGNANGDDWKDILVVFNANKEKVSFNLEGIWAEALSIEKGYHEDGKVLKDNIKLDPLSAYVFYRN